MTAMKDSMAHLAQLDYPGLSETPARLARKVHQGYSGLLGWTVMTERPAPTE
jgi:hypothetical protein